MYFEGVMCKQGLLIELENSQPLKILEKTESFLKYSAYIIDHRTCCVTERAEGLRGKHCDSVLMSTGNDV